MTEIFPPGWLHKKDYRERVPELADGAETIVEVGVWRGALSEKLALVPSLKRLYLVDPWSFTGQNEYFKQQMESVYRSVLRKVESWSAPGREVTILRMTGIEAASMVEGPVDFLHMDINAVDNDTIIDKMPHGDPDVIRATIQAWIPKIRSGGLLTGNDYEQKEVAPAVRETLPAVKIEGLRLWVWRKP